MDTPERPIVIRNSQTGESFEFNPPDATWFDMLAFCEAAGLTIEELINQALENFFRKHTS